MTALKTCSHCAQQKPHADFSRQAAARDGRQRACKSCVHERKLKWIAANLERVREKERTSSRKLYAADPSKKIAAVAKRRANKRSVTAALSAGEQALIERMYELRSLVEELLGCSLHIDHQVPLARGGRHELSNLRYIPAHINSAKRDRLDHECGGETGAFLNGAYEYEQATFVTHRRGRRPD